MGNYKAKLLRRRAAYVETEPKDDYSVIPSHSLRLYFRARAGMYGLTQCSYRQLKIELSPYSYANFLRHTPRKFSVLITEDSAVPLGELFRDIRRRKSVKLNVFSVPFGGRMKIKVRHVEESHSPRVCTEELTVAAHAFVLSGKPLRKEWLQNGIVIPMARL